MDDFIALKILTKAKAEFIINEKTYIMKPLVPRKLREIGELYEKSRKEITDFEKWDDFYVFLLEKISDIFPIIFDAPIDKDSIDNHLSLPLIREIWDTLLKLNRLDDVIPFFAQAIKLGVSVNQIKKV